MSFRPARYFLGSRWPTPKPKHSCSQHTFIYCGNGSNFLVKPLPSGENPRVATDFHRSAPIFVVKIYQRGTRELLAAKFNWSTWGQPASAVQVTRALWILLKN